MSLRGDVRVHSPSSFYGSASTNSGQGAVVYLCVWGIGVASFYIFLLDFGTVPTVGYVLFFVI